MDLTPDEQDGLKGKYGKSIQMAYRILVATGEATDAERLVPIKWAHLAGVNYNTIGDAGQEFLSSISQDVRVKVRTTLNPMGFDIDNVSDYSLDENFIAKQLSIKDSYEKMGVIPSFSCIPYEIFDIPQDGTQVAFAESNAAIHANSYDNLKTNKESAFSALASAIIGKSPYSSLRKEDDNPSVTIQMDIKNPDELTYGMLGFFAGKVGDTSVNISGLPDMDNRQRKAMCGGMGTSGTCAKFIFDGDNNNNNISNKNNNNNNNKDAANSNNCEKIVFDEKEMQNVHDELNTASKGDIITLGSPQLGYEEVADLVNRLDGKTFQKRCMVFVPRTVKEQAKKIGYTEQLERAGCEILSDCCTCLSPLINKDNVDAVTTNSIKGAFYLKNANGVGVNLKPLSQIIRDETVPS